MNELGKLVRPQSPTRMCQISPEDSSHIGHILSETQLKDKCGVKLLGMRSNEIVCALSSKTIFLSNSGQVVSNIDLPYYWCNFCAFKTEDKRLLLRHLMEHRFNCQYCIYQTFSRVDVVRHMVKEHNQFDSENFKFCVLLPDLLKYEMNNCDDKNSEQRKSPTPPLFQHVEEETEEKPKRKRGRPKKRCLTDQTPSPKKKKVEEEEGKRELGSDNTTIVTPGVCFECCLCKFRTLQNSILTAHNNSEHGRPRPSLSLKLVSQSQAKEIEEMDKKISVKIERCLKPVETPTEEEQKDQSTQENDKDDENINDDTEKDFVRSSKKRKNEKKNREREFVNPRNTEKRMYKCLLCTNKVSDQFSIVKQHYIEEHPGGTQAMCEFDVDGSSEKINYFCVGDNCEFQDTEVLSWLSHLCMKNAMKKLNPQNSCTEDIPVTVIENLGLLVVQNPKPTESEPVIGDLQLSPVKQAVQNIKQEMSDYVHLPSSHNDQSLESVPVYNLALPENDRSDKENVFFQNQPKIQKQPDKNNHMSQVTDMILAQSYNALKERIQIRNKNSIQVRSEQFSGTAPEYICGNGDFSDIVTAGITSSRSASSAPTNSPSSTSGLESGKRIIHGPFENRGRNWALTTSTPNQENSNKNVQEDEEDEVVIVGMTGGQFVTSPPYSNPSSSTSSYQANSIAEDNLSIVKNDKYCIVMIESLSECLCA